MASSLRRRRKRPRAAALLSDTSASLRKLVLCLPWLWLHPVAAGVSELTWEIDFALGERRNAVIQDTDGNAILCGCVPHSTGAAAITTRVYVAKYATNGDQLWLQTAASLKESSSDCATTMASDSNGNLFITGVTSTHSDTGTDDDMFVLKLSSEGQLLWQQVFGTPLQESVQAIHVAPQVGGALFVGGFSTGDLAMGSTSEPNCFDSCDEGFVLKLEADTGETRWIHRIRSLDLSISSSTRVFDVALDEAGATLVVVGETTGDLGREEEVVNVVGTRSDLFVRRVNITTGQTLWTTQFGDANQNDRCRSSAGLGRCSLSVLSLASNVVSTSTDTVSREWVFMAGTTNGLVSTLTSEQSEFAAICGQGSAATCGVAMLAIAKLDIVTGSLDWVMQIISTQPRTLVLQLLEIAPDSLVLLSEANNKAIARRISAPTGGTAWNADLGFVGSTSAFAPVMASLQSEFAFALGAKASESNSLVLMKYELLKGTRVPLCADLISFKANATITNVQQQQTDPLVVILTVERQNENCGVGEISYSTTSLLSSIGGSSAGEAAAVANKDYAAIKGIVRFAQSQTSAQIVVQVLAANARSAAVSDSDQHRSFALVLEPTRSDSLVQTPNTTQIRIELIASSSDEGGGADDGAFWHSLSQYSLIAVGSILVLVLLLGRVCGVGLRRAKNFRYRRLSVEQDEALELKAHLAQIQHVNAALDALVDQATSLIPEPTPVLSARKGSSSIGGTNCTVAPVPLTKPAPRRYSRRKRST